jgi:glutamate-1-semialdehyde aminotransferase
MKNYNAKNLKPAIMEFAEMLAPVDTLSESLKNDLISVLGKGRFMAIDLDGKTHHVDFVGNWGRLYLGHQFGKVDLNKVDLVYRY